MVTKIKEPDPNDPFCIHEALSMSYFLQSSVDSQLLEHPTIINHPDLTRIAEAASECLVELYQRLGALSAKD